MKMISIFIGAIALLVTGAVYAASGVVTTATGSVQVQRGGSPQHSLRQGDDVNQGDTVFTGANSSVVIKFDDGQVAALTSNSRMTVTAYDYNPQSQGGNVLLSLIAGGMRAVTGLIGRNTPERVSYRAASATIGIRGTDVTIILANGAVVVTVTEGAVTFTFGGRTVVIPAGQGVNGRSDGTFQQDTIQQILNQVPADIVAAVGGLQALSAALRQAGAGQPRSGTTEPGAPTSTTPGATPAGPAGGGGTASPS